MQELVQQKGQNRNLKNKQNGKRLQPTTEKQ